MERDEVRVLLVGCGHMGASILHGLIRDGFPQKNITVVVKDRTKHEEELIEHYEELSILGADEINTHANYIVANDAIIVATKPDQMEEAVKPIAELLEAEEEKPMVFSVVGGKSLKQIAAMVPGTAIIRAMPNINAMEGVSITPYCTSEHKEEIHDMVDLILGAIGEVRPMPEKDMPQVTAISGSGPAYIFRVLRLMVEEAQSAGLNAKAAGEAALEAMRQAMEQKALPVTEFSELQLRVTQGLMPYAHVFKSGYLEKAQELLRDRFVAEDLVTATWMGSLHTFEELLEDEFNPTAVAEKLIRWVRSPGGTTHAALSLLEDNEKSDAEKPVPLSLNHTVEHIGEAIDAAHIRALQLAHWNSLLKSRPKQR